MAESPLWTGKKRTVFGLPWTFTTYTLTDTCLFIRSGFFTVREEEIRLYRILDVTLRQSFRERLFGLGTLHLCTSDQSAPEVDIKRIKHPKEVRTILSDRAAPTIPPGATRSRGISAPPPATASPTC